MILTRSILMILTLSSAVGLANAQDRLVFDTKINFENEAAAPGAGDKRTTATANTVSEQGLRRRKAVTSSAIGIKNYNSRLIAAVYREAARHKIDPVLVFSLIWQESAGKLRVVSPKGAKGALQLMPGTAARYGVTNPFDPDQAVTGGVAYLVWLLDRYHGNVAQALAGYNAGEGSVDAFSTGRTLVLKTGKVINRGGVRREIPPYAETENYVERIASNYRRLRQLKAAAQDSEQH